MIRHDLHCKDSELILRRQLSEHFLKIRIHAALENLLSVLCAPDDVVLKRIHIASTICKVTNISIKNVFIHI